MSRTIGTRTKDTMRIIEAVQSIINPDNPTTARFVCYKLISTGVLKSTKQYHKLLNILRDARVNGDIDDDCFIDSKRTVNSPTTWLTMEAFRADTLSWYSKDYWADQKEFPIVLAEKGTVGLVLSSVCSAHQTPLFISSGYYSRPFLCRLADMILEHNGGPVHIAYVGDHDASGLDLERAARMGNGEEGSKRREGLYEILMGKVKGGEAAWYNLTWDRLAITYEDLQGFESFQLVPTKHGDTRTKKYEDSYGEFGAEVEALDQDVLQDRVSTFIMSHANKKAWENSKLIEQKEKNNANNQ